MRILVRTSRWAVWARRFGALALPLAAIPILLHRQHIITSENFIDVEIVALVIAGLALVSAVIAIVRLWFTGDQGWWKATLALLFSALCLGPAVFFAWEAVHYPEASDVTTDFVNPPMLVSFTPQEFTSPAERVRIEAAFPNARSRNYPITATQIFDVVAGLVDDRGWDLRARRVPENQLDTGQLNAVVTTLLGFRQEIAIRVAGGAEGTSVAVRSASLYNFPDFAENGRRIEAFLLDLDAQVTLMLRDAPAQPAAAN
jgi:Protein of unknown function (DUF1499)